MIATLVYLALQVRHNAAASTSSTQQSHAEAFTRLSSLVIENSEVAKLLAHAEQSSPGGSQALPREDEIRMEWLATRIFATYESAYTDAQSGLFETDLWGVYEGYYREAVRRPGFQTSWETHNGGECFRD